MSGHAALCANCNNKVNGKYCGECGQRSHVGRLSMHELLHELWHAFTHTDKGILRLIKYLFLHPGSVYKNYFKGQRKHYFSPIIFFLVAAGLLVYLDGLVFDYDDKINHTHNEFGRGLSHLIKYRALVLLPVETLLTWAIFRKRFNLAEVTSFWLFCMGFVYTINIILIPLYFPLIRHKHFLDVSMSLLTYIVIFWHGSVVLANRKWYNILLIFVLVNVVFVLDGALNLYLIFGSDMISDDNYMGITNVWELIKNAYTF
jgi:hypothetical protein